MARDRFWLLMLVLCIFESTFLSEAAMASDSSGDSGAQAALSVLSSTILHKELELERSNLRFLLNSHSEGRFKPWRYFIFQETDAALLEAGLLTGIADRHHQLVHGGSVKAVFLEDSLVPQMVGQFTGPVGDLLELGLNARQSLKAHLNGMDAGQSKRRAIRLHRELIAELQARDSILQKYPSLCTPLIEAETRVMQDEERLAWLQYSGSLLEANKAIATENTFYLLDIVKNLNGALGNLVGLVAIHAAEPRLNIGANTLTTVSGAFIMTNPITSRIFGKLAAHLHSNSLDENYKQDMRAALASLTADTVAMQDVYKVGGTSSGAKDKIFLTRVELYTKHLERAGRYVESQNAKDRKANTAALGRVAIGLLAGGSKVAAGTAGLIAADRLGAHAAAPLLIGGTTAYAAGTDLTLGDNLMLNIKHETRYHTQKNSGTAVKDILSLELGELDRLDDQLIKVESVR
jgi:hypothetical protein